MTPLEEYRRKRDFTRTTEPAPRPQKEPGRDLSFVIQQHDATRMHWDFRLEFGGVLVSWAVPKGPSYQKADKRMAAHVEDHPIEYGTFEGVIPKGEYGAGPVIVWDHGTYSPDEGGVLAFGDPEEAERRMAAELAAGKISITLRGQKLRGSWTLVRTSKGDKDWLLIKHTDRYADSGHDVLTEDRSVQSYRTLDEVGRHVPPPKLPSVPRPGNNIAEIPGARPAPFPSYSKGPMFAATGERAFDNPEWWFELKLDGVRLLAFVRDGRVTLRSRSNRDLTRQFPTVVGGLAQQVDPEMVIDGEVVAFGADGQPDFETLATRIHLAGDGAVQQADVTTPVVFYAFDLLYLDGHELTQVPLYQRKALLRERLVESDHITYLDHVAAEGVATFQFAQSSSLEGVVAKKLASRYEPGARSQNWLKLKTVSSQDFVVGGWSEGEGGRKSSFGSLIVGFYDWDRLVYAGNVGSGFDDRTLAKLKAALEPLATDVCPFAEPKTVASPTPAHWVRPELVAEVRYTQWTHEGRLRAPVFLRLRADREPEEVSEPEHEEVAVVSVPEEHATDIGGLIARLDAAKPEEAMLEVEGNAIKLTNLDKVFWPAQGKFRQYTKRDMIRYYIQVSPWLLPHLRDRPLTMTRYPNGIFGEFFYQKHFTYDIPPFVDTVPLWSSQVEQDNAYVLVNNLATLVWLEQLADLELHPWLSRIAPEPDAAGRPQTFDRTRERMEASVLNYPDFMNFDLDPYIYSGKEKDGGEPEFNRRAFDKVREIALYLRELLVGLGLRPYVKTSGKTGLHVYVPILRQYDFDTIRSACGAVGKFLVQQRPKEVTMEWSVKNRTGKIFFDHNMNTRGKNMASIYSLRPALGAPASVPVTWEELKDVYPPDFTIETAPKRLAAVGDLWSEILADKQDLRGVVEGLRVEV